MRAQLEIESFVTGQLWIVLELQPGSDAMFRAADPPYPEIPTMPSNISEILTRLQDWVTEVQENVDIGELSRNINSVLSGIDELVHSKDLQDALAGINQFVNDDQTQELAGELQSALAQVRLAAEDARTLFRNAEESVDSLAVDMNEIQERLDTTLAEAENTLAAARQRLRGDSEQLYRLSATLDEIEKAARAMRQFFDYIERNPEALLRGKSE